MDVSIIIVNYKSFEYIKTAINSVFEKTQGLAYEIIVVDNNSPDQSGELISTFFLGKIIYVQSEKNLGFGGANNLGLEQAKGRNILFLNPDTKLINNAVKILSDFLDNNKQVGVCGGNLFDENMQPAHSYRTFFPGFLWELHMLLGRLSKWFYGQDFNTSNSIKEVAYITGADMMVRKLILDKVGAFDTDFFLYFEETELSFRIRKAGFKSMNIPQAKINHYESKTITNKKHKINLMYESRRKYYTKTTSQIKHRCIDYTLYAIVGFKIAIFTLVNLKDKKKYWISILKSI